MPIRVKLKKVPKPREPSPGPSNYVYVDLPEIREGDSFRDVIKALSRYFTAVITLPHTLEQLRTSAAGSELRSLVDHLALNCSNPTIVNALLALKWHYGADGKTRDLSTARAYACEIVAWRFLSRLSEREAVDYCLYEIPELDLPDPIPETIQEEFSFEHSPLLPHSNGSHGRRTMTTTVSSVKRGQLLQSLSRLTASFNIEEGQEEEEEDPTAPFRGLNALEIAAISNSKQFLAQGVVQKILTAIWNGDIVFWDQLSVYATKKPRYYNPATADPFCRLRVPKYLKIWEIFFFLMFMALYYTVLVERDIEVITGTEYILYILLGAFLYDEISAWRDAGSIFYTSDIWNLFDMIMIILGITFAVLKNIGIYTHTPEAVEVAFDIFALEALFMVPRICSFLSLSPYWGTLIPCFKEMAKDFVKFMILVIIVYCGFLTTFSLIGRNSFTFSRMTMILTKIFFGSSGTGIEIMDDIDPVFGPPLMLLFICLSSFLLTGSLTGMLSNSFSRVITQAREEYLFVYSIYVLEASTSNRLTHFLPPFNLVSFFIFRPLRFFFHSETKFRAGRIALLKITHAPVVGAIMLYESLRRRNAQDEFAGFKGPSFNQEDTLRPSHGQGSTGDGKSSRVNDMASKIDRLTLIILNMQEKEDEYRQQLQREKEEREKREAKEKEEREQKEAKEKEEREKREAKEKEEREQSEAKEKEEKETKEREEKERKAKKEQQDREEKEKKEQEEREAREKKEQEEKAEKERKEQQEKEEKQKKEQEEREAKVKKEQEEKEKREQEEKKKREQEEKEKKEQEEKEKREQEEKEKREQEEQAKKEQEAKEDDDQKPSDE
ncbi:unnamed protein product [Parascedosporium putredinis]|uniref:Calcium channel YVC1-like C-terminal transmembrane domain-containing protein n=1 Tax=Parascedosporium putredinis TaxID=1442378 RepID=A0A9P1GVS3_9PEZI|nr:unnamed protein product [Parascedosporium putredinis]CAI7987961.1 unnamed protein product [Parascedosporium putredinis]